VALQSLGQAQTVLVLIIAFTGRLVGRLCEFRGIIENLVDLSSIFQRVDHVKAQRWLIFLCAFA